MGEVGGVSARSPPVVADGKRDPMWAAPRGGRNKILRCVTRAACFWMRPVGTPRSRGQERAYLYNNTSEGGGVVVQQQGSGTRVENPMTIICLGLLAAATLMVAAAANGIASLVVAASVAALACAGGCILLVK